MGAYRPFPHVFGGYYADGARPWSSQDCVNFLPMKAERPGTRSPWKLRTPPGLVPFCNLNTGLPVRGTHDVEGLLLAVSGTTLFRVTPQGVATSVGTIPGVGRVSMAHNQQTVGNQVAIANGQAGYVYNTDTGALVQITDSAFPGARVFDFVDGYLAFVEPQGRYWAHSDLANALEYNSLDRNEAESAPDKHTTLIVSNREVAVFGPRTGEFFRNSGANTGTFQRLDGTELEVGIASTFAVARLDNTLYFLGHDGVVYRLQGHQQVRVSTGPIEELIAARNIANAFALTWEDRSHKVFYLTFPDGETIGFDVWTDEWHRRQSFGMDRWRLNTLTLSNGEWIGGDYTNGKLYRVDWDTVSEDSLPLVRRRRFAVLHGDGNDIGIEGIKLHFDVGRVPVGVTDHFCSIRYSDDGGHNFSSARIASIGAAGRYNQTIDERRWGQTCERVWDVEVSSPAKSDLIGAEIMLEEAAS
jgi:hypothetical protein